MSNEVNDAVNNEQKQEESRAQRVYNYVKEHPWTNSRAVTEDTGIPTVRAATALHDLTKSRKLVRVKLAPEERPHKNVLFKYKVRERNLNAVPKRRARRAGPVVTTEHTSTTVSAATSSVQIMLAVGKNETLVLSLAEAKALAKQLQVLV